MEHQARILIVEDEIIVAENLRSDLERLGYSVCGIAISGEEALALTHEQKPGLILMDIHLKGDQDGIATAGAITASFQIPVIYLTAYCDDETLRRAKETEPFGYLLKPYVLNELKSVIEMALYKHEMEERLRRHQTLIAHMNRVNSIEQMATGIAHELNQPLSAITTLTDGCLQLLKQSPDCPAEINEGLEEVSRQARRAGGIIQRIRRFVKKNELKVTKFDLNYLLRRVGQLIKPDLVLHETSLRYQLVGQALMVEADELQIEQVVLNLLRNGLEAMLTEPGGRRELVLSSSLEQGRCEVRVRDYGPGVPSDMADSLFHAFCSTKGEGMGVGLAITKSILEYFGGTISYRNCDSGGAEFIFSLPYCPTRHLTAVESEHHKNVSNDSFAR